MAVCPKNAEYKMVFSPSAQIPQAIIIGQQQRAKQERSPLILISGKHPHVNAQFARPNV